MSTQALEIRIAHLEGACEQIDKRLGSVEQRMIAHEQKTDRQFSWILGLLILSILLPIASHLPGH